MSDSYYKYAKIYLDIQRLLAYEGMGGGNQKFFTGNKNTGVQHLYLLYFASYINR